MGACLSVTVEDHEHTTVKAMRFAPADFPWMCAFIRIWIRVNARGIYFWRECRDEEDTGDVGFIK